MALKAPSKEEVMTAFGMINKMDQASFSSLCRAVWQKNEPLCERTADMVQHASIHKIGLTEEQAEQVGEMYQVILASILYILEDAPRFAGLVN